MEDLKSKAATEADYQEVRELKEQIQIMRKELQTQMDNNSRSDSPQSPMQDAGPVIMLQPAENAAENQAKTAEELEQLQFEVSFIGFF